MSKNKKILRNIIILLVLAILVFKRSGLYLTPLAAHESSERSIHYGPSEVIHVEDFDKGKYILGKYDKWVSCNTVNRKLFFFWRFGNQPIGFENDQSKAIDFSWGATKGKYNRVYGIVNDHQIEEIQVTLENGTIFTEKEFYDDLFLFAWETDMEDEDYLSNITGYDGQGNTIFEYESLR